MSKETGGPAFPRPHSEPQYFGAIAQAGMTLRDYFAAKAMQAMLSSSNCPSKVCERELSSQAYATADAMLEARK